MMPVSSFGRGLMRGTIAAVAVALAIGIWILSASHPPRGAYIGWALATVALATFVAVARRGDLLEPVRLFALLYGVSFGLGPLILEPLGAYQIPYLGPQGSDLLQRGAAVAFAGLAATMAGYFLRAPKELNGAPPLSTVGAQKAAVLACGAIVMLVGLALYAKLMFAGGGLSAFLRYSGGRSEIFTGVFGGYYWGAFLLIAGMCIVCSELAAQRPRLALALGLGIGLLFAPFQGRDEVLAPLFCALVLIHYQRKRLSMQGLALLGVVFLVVAAIIGQFRATDFVARDRMLRDTSGLVSGLASNAAQSGLGLLSKNVEQMDSLLLAMRFVDKNPHGLEGRTFIQWLEPLDRHLFGGELDAVHAGRHIAILANPEYAQWVTAASPSLVGELYLNWGLSGVLAGSLLYGALLQSLYRLLAASRNRAVLLALAPYLLWVLVKTTIDGSVLWFRMLIVAAPILLAAAMLGRRDRFSFRTQASRLPLPIPHVRTRAKPLNILR